MIFVAYFVINYNRLHGDPNIGHSFYHNEDHSIVIPLDHLYLYLENLSTYIDYIFGCSEGINGEFVIEKIFSCNELKKLILIQ